MVRTRRIFILAAVAVASCGGGGRITDRLVLDSTQVRAGQAIQGTLLVDNSGSPIDLTELATIELHPGDTRTARLTECRPAVAVGLSNRDVTQEPAFAFSCSPLHFSIVHGTTRIPVTVTTTYLGCQQLGDVGITPGGVACRNGDQPPPLPAGRYRTRVVWSETVPIPAPAAVMVRLTR